MVATVSGEMHLIDVKLDALNIPYLDRPVLFF